SRQETEEPLGILLRSRKRTHSDQTTFWASPTAPVRFTVACTAGPRGGPDPQRHELFVQCTSARFPTLYHLPRFLALGYGNCLGVSAWGQARLLRLPPLAGRRLSLGGCSLVHLGEQTHAKVGGDRTDVRQSLLIQGAQETGDAIDRIGDDGREGHSPGV